jgi:RNA polymerase sigma-70 factor (ECF subfamily)
VKASAASGTPTTPGRGGSIFRFFKTMPSPIDALAPETWAPFAPILEALLGDGGLLDRALREAIALGAAANFDAPGDRGGAAIALVEFCRRLAQAPAAIGRPDFEGLRAAGFADEAILEAVLATGCGTLLGVLARASTAPTALPARGAAPAGAPAAERDGPYLATIERTADELPSFAALQKQFGFVPRIFRAQALLPAAVEAQARVLETLLFAPSALTRAQKESILVAVSAAGGNTYGATLHGRALQMTGVPAERIASIADAPESSDLPDAEKALLEAARRLAALPGDPPSHRLERLLGHGWSAEQVHEAVGLAALGGFLTTVQFGLGVKPDFRPKRDFLTDPPRDLNLSGAVARPREDERLPSAPVQDPDGPSVAAARGGDMTAFEALVRRHQGRVYRTLMGITGNAEDAQDGAQSVFLKVFRKLGDFGGESLFSTWLHRIAVNEGLERLRSRKPTESLEEDQDADFRPVHLAPWIEDPETRFVRAEMKRLVEEALGRLPAPYRTALLLRDIQQLSGLEAAAILGIPLPTLKTRLLRGRLMLREALAVHIAGPLKTASA